MRSALLGMGVNKPTANIICSDEFDVKNQVHMFLERGDAARVRAEHASKILILENVVLLLVGLATVGVVTLYIITYIYSGLRLARYLFAWVPYTVFMSRHFVVRKTGRFMGSRLMEAFTILILALFVLLQVVHLALLPLLALGVYASQRSYRWEAKRRARLKREGEFLRALVGALSRRGLEAKAGVLRLAAGFGQLRVCDLACNPGIPAILERLSATMVGGDNRFVLRVFSRAIGALGYTPSWYRSAWALLRVYEKLRVELSQQAAKNTLVACVMFSVSSLSITLLSNTAFFRFSLGQGISLIPTIALDACYIGFSYIYPSETLYTALFFALLVGQVIMVYAI